MTNIHSNEHGGETLIPIYFSFFILVLWNDNVGGLSHWIGSWVDLRRLYIFGGIEI